MTSLCLILLLWAIVYGALAGILRNPVAFEMSHRAVTAPCIQTILETLQELYEVRVTAMRMNATVYFQVIIPLLSELHGHPIRSHSEA